MLQLKVHPCVYSLEICTENQINEENSKKLESLVASFCYKSMTKSGRITPQSYYTIRPQSVKSVL